MNISHNYEKEHLAVRYALMIQNTDSRIRAEGYKKLIEYCKRNRCMV